jgi:hypothetical protein
MLEHTGLHLPKSTYSGYDTLSDTLRGSVVG